MQNFTFSEFATIFFVRSLSRELLFFFSALGAFNGLILGLYFLFWIKPKTYSNFFLGILLIMLSIRTGKSVFFHFNPELAEVYLQIGLAGCFFIGPFLYFYLRSFTEEDSKIKEEWKVHLVGLIPLIAILIYYYNLDPTLDRWRHFVNSIYFVWELYTIAAAITLKTLFVELIQKKRAWSNKDKWILSVYLGNVLILITYLSFPYVSYIVGALSFTFIVYLVVLVLIFNKKGSSLFKKTGKYSATKTMDSETENIINELTELMTSETLYRDPNLTMPMVAKRLGILNHKLSQVINDHLDKNFPALINEYRIEEAKRMLVSNDTYTLEAIGYECGFNSKSTFFATFKKQTGFTPSQYKKKAS